MKLDRGYSLKEFAELIGAQMKGPADHVITGINEIHKVVPGDLVFVDHPKYYEKALASAATTVLIDNADVECPAGKALLISEQPFRDFNALTSRFKPEVKKQDQHALDLQIGSGSHISPGVHIGQRVSIGKDCYIYPGVVLNDDTQLGDRVIIHANTVIGGDAFYYKQYPTGRVKLHTCGAVIIEDDVEIGALCTIDRGVTGDTRIGAGTKLDCQVHIGHDTVVGKNCLMAAQVGVAGCVIIEDDVTLWGQAGIPSGRRVGKGAVLLGQSAIMYDAEPGKVYLGSPAQERRTAFLELALLKRLPELFKKKDGNG
jgi:UDP-3-O-[3-hydroxymyristoyl] glucosamine N-acyltransferase